MKIILNILILIIFSNHGFSQSGWILQHSGTTSKLYSIHFLNLETGWCVGDSGTILKTTNSGTTWTQQSLGFWNNFRVITFPSTTVGYIVGDSGVILKTVDSGLNWLDLSFNNEFLSSMFFIDDDIGFVGTKYHNSLTTHSLFKTTNGGKNWDSIYSDAVINNIFFIDQWRGWSAQPLFSSDGLFFTSNGGLNWTLQFGGSGNGGHINSIFFIDSLYGWIGSPNGESTTNQTIGKTTDGGNNWIRYGEFTIFSNIQSIYFVNRNRGWAAGDFGGILYTTNGGSNWIRSPFSQIAYRSIYFIDSLTGWCIGDSGRILKTTTGGLTFLNNQVSIVATNYFLSQNYPNPFNPRTKVSYKLGFSSFVKLKVYNVLGNEVLTLVNERKQSGKYEVEFDADNLSSGIYLYSLIVNENTIDTKRMVLLK